LRSGRFLRTPIGLGALLVIILVLATIAVYFGLIMIGFAFHDLILPGVCTVPDKLWGGCFMLGVLIFVFGMVTVMALGFLLLIATLIVVGVTACFMESRRVWGEHKRELLREVETYGSNETTKFQENL